MSFRFTRDEADQYQESNDALPAGKYRAMVTQVEDRETKSGTGRYLLIKYQVIEGEYANWYTTDMINYQNENPKAQTIGWQQLKKLVAAIWSEFPEEFTASDLENQTVTILTKTEEYNGRLQSKVKGYVAVPKEEDDVPGFVEQKAEPVQAPAAKPAIAQINRVSAKPAPRPAAKNDVPF